MDEERDKYTRFEKARIIGARALQISFGAPIMIDVPPQVIDPLTIAEKEFEANAIPITLAKHKEDTINAEEYMNYLKSYFKVTLEEWFSKKGAVREAEKAPPVDKSEPEKTSAEPVDEDVASGKVKQVPSKKGDTKKENLKGKSSEKVAGKGDSKKKK